ncbi:DUF551 domain-containing protein [Cronobacter malonaticus]
MNTVSNEVLEKLSVRYRLLAKIHDGNESQAWEESALIVEELLALRKEREAAVPVAYMIGGHYLMHANDPKVDNYSSSVPLYTAPPALTDKTKSEMTQMAEKLVRDTTALAVTLSSETDTTRQQFESLAGKAVYGWIPCSERMPDYGVDVQIFCSDTREQFVGFRCIGDNDFQYGHYEDFSLVCSPSHWQPLPEPPCK